MKITKKCAICDYEFTYDDKFSENPYITPNSAGSKYYYDLWHFMVEMCPNCGYASKDISQTLNKKIISDIKYNTIKDMQIIVDMNEARPNMILQYLKASVYYASIGEKLSEIKCMLQASDLIYAEMMYWDEYVLDKTDETRALASQKQYDEFKKFSDSLFNRAIWELEKYSALHPEDLDTALLLAGTLGDGDKLQSIKGVRLLNSLKNKPLSAGQKQALDYLFDSI